MDHHDAEMDGYETMREIPNRQSFARYPSSP